MNNIFFLQYEIKVYYKYIKSDKTKKNIISIKDKDFLFLIYLCKFPIIYGFGCGGHVGVWEWRLIQLLRCHNSRDTPRPPLSLNALYSSIKPHSFFLLLLLKSNHLLLLELLQILVLDPKLYTLLVIPYPHSFLGLGLGLWVSGRSSRDLLFYFCFFLMYQS